MLNVADVLINRRKLCTYVERYYRSNRCEIDGFCCSYRFINPEHRDKFGIVVSYVARVKLTMGTLGGELTAEVPFTLMNPPPDDCSCPVSKRTSSVFT